MKTLIFSCIESRIEKNQSLYGCFKIGPFFLNQGLTVANTLRRVLLSNLEGLAIVFVQMEGVKHEYSIIKGVQESVLEILTNLKQIPFKTDQVLYKPQVAYLNIRGPKVVYSSDIELPASISCIQPSHYIAKIAVDGQLKMKLFICQGKRYCLQNSLKSIIQKQFRKILNLKSRNYLFLDAIFLPIQKVNFAIEENNELINEFIIMEIWTNGSLHPKQSFYKAVNEIIQIMLPFRKLKSLQTRKIIKPLPVSLIRKRRRSTLFKKSNSQTLNKINSLQFQIKLSSLDIGNLNLSFQTYYYLKKRKIHTILDLLKKSKKELFSLEDFKPEFFDDIESSLLMFGLNIRQ